MPGLPGTTATAAASGACPPARSTAWRIADWLLGLSVIGWGVAGVTLTPADERTTPVRLLIATLHLVVGLLILRRSPMRIGPGIGQVLAALPALLVGGWALAVAPAPGEWSTTAVALFAVGALVGAGSLLTLGRSFAILPAVRGVVVSGPYRLVRHPAYLGELLMVAACGAAAGTVTAWLPAAVGVPLLAMRILAEEQLLARDTAWLAYSGRVRWRLLPLVW